MAELILKDFQQATVDWVVQRFFEENNPTNRFLVADEVGLGKTLVAKGVIEAFKKRFMSQNIKSLNVIYICSNQTIANQNLTKLNIENSAHSYTNINRLNDLATIKISDKSSFFNITALSPDTSFNISRGGGEARERAILFHILKRHTVFKDYSYKLSKLLQQSKGEGWALMIDKKSELAQSLREDVAKEFNEKFDPTNEVYEDLLEYCEERFNKTEKKSHVQIIGKLRHLLASICVSFMKPDLIILDEFQRFKNLLESNGDIKIITEKLFNDTKLLLLSATPYKMFTIHKEVEAGIEHLQEFEFIIEFLINNDENYQKFKSQWRKYSNELKRLTDSNFSSLKNIKDSVQSILFQYMCRTERISVSKDRNTMVRQGADKFIPIEPQDLESFIATDSLAYFLSKYFSNIHSPVEFCKSSAYPFSFLEGYQLNHYAHKAIEDGLEGFIDELKKQKNAFLNKVDIDNYREIKFSNPKLRYLIKDSLDQGCDLLWIPPTLPYYNFQGSYIGKESFSKTLVFSSWTMVPKMISGLVSYEFERRTIGNNKLGLYKGETKSKYSSERKRLKRLSFIRPDKEDSFPSLNQYCILYPSVFLTDLWSIEFKHCISNTDLLNSLKEKLDTAWNQVNYTSYLDKSNNKEDSRWYFIAMILLDRHYCEKTIQKILEESTFKWEFNEETATESSIAVDYFRFVYYELLGSKRRRDLNKFELELSIKEGYSNNNTYFEGILNGLNLGLIPDDLIVFLAKLTISSPAISSFRSFKSFAIQNSQISFAFEKATEAAESFRKYFNIPENIATIEKTTPEDVYFKNVIEYSYYGNFQSMLDEYIQIIIDSNGISESNPLKLIEAVTKKLVDNTGLRTSSVSYQTVNSFVELVDSNTQVSKRHLRCNYAVALGDRFVVDKQVARASDVRNSFNSPFKPFILSSTSVGQEGLDFHLYCRKLLHWNLPSNPVDFEQREGRINRYKNLAIRKNISNKYRSEIDSKSFMEAWSDLFEIAREKERNNQSDLIPYWHVEPENIFIERQTPLIPFSKDEVKLDSLIKSLTVYRLTLGQPQQEEIVSYLLNKISPEKLLELQNELLINLCPLTKN